MTRKFTFKDTQPWVVVDVHGNVLTRKVNTKNGVVTIESYDGYRSAAAASQILGGFAVRK